MYRVEVYGTTPKARSDIKKIDAFVGCFDTYREAVKQGKMACYDGICKLDGWNYY